MEKKHIIYYINIYIHIYIYIYIVLRIPLFKGGRVSFDYLLSPEGGI